MYNNSIICEFWNKWVATLFCVIAGLLFFCLWMLLAFVNLPLFLSFCLTFTLYFSTIFTDCCLLIKPIMAFTRLMIVGVVVLYLTLIISCDDRYTVPYLGITILRTNYKLIIALHIILCSIKVKSLVHVVHNSCMTKDYLNQFHLFTCFCLFVFVLLICLVLLVFLLFYPITHNTAWF